jgi:tetratricopeptide (TPR) repeat protein
MNTYQKIKNCCFSLAFGLLLANESAAQKTAIYRDADATYQRGMGFYEQGLYGKAQEEFAIMLAAEPTGTSKDARTQRLRAELYRAVSALRLDNPDAEKDLLSFIYRNEPASIASVAKLEVGRYYYAKKDHDKTIQYLGSIPSGDLNNAELSELKFQLAYAHFSKKDFKKARPMFQQIRNIKGNYYEPSNYYYGLSAYYENDLKEALESFKLVVNDKKHRYNTIVPAYICQIYFAQKEYKEVISYGKTVVSNTDLREREQVSKLIGQSYFELKDYAGALPYLTQYVEKTSKVPQEDVYQLAYTQYRTASYAKAIPNFEQLNNLNTDLGQNALYNLADCYLKTGNKIAARQAFERASNMNFDKNVKEDAFINYAKLSYELGFDSEAIKALQKIDEKSDYHSEAQNLLSSIFLNTRDYDNALITLRALTPKTAKIKETHQKVAYYRGIQLHRDRKTAEAIKLFEESLSIDGKNQEVTALTHFWKAEAHYQQDATDKAISDYNAYLKIANNLKNSTLPANSMPEIAHYGLGYAYIKQGKYPQAADNFDQTVKTLKPKRINIADRYVTEYVYPDALLRAGDCYLYQNNYGKAAGFYRDIIDNNYGNTDYALYQLSITYQLSPTPQYYEQLALLDKIVKNHPQSLYADDALYSMGNTYFALKRLDMAKESYARIEQEYPQSEHRNRALLKQGLISYGTGNKEEALRYYEAAFRNNPQGEEAKDALALMEDIYVETGNPDGFFNFLGTVSGYSVNEDERDSVMYRSAERKFNAAEWQAAAAGFTTYLQRYPSGNKSQRARFYRAEANFELKNYADALPDYKNVSEQNNPAFAEIANLRAANICYHINGNYDEAYTYYTRLDKYATTQDNRYEAQLYGARSAYRANKMDELFTAATKFLTNPRASQIEKAEAYFYLGKVHFAKKDYAKAKVEFNRNIDLSTDDLFSAEARYRVAYIAYIERDLTKAKELCFKTNKEVPNHIDWIARSFILLADIHAEEGNLFQAKSTLESIIANYKGDETILQEARTKLANVKKAEADKSKIK